MKHVFIWLIMLIFLEGISSDVAAKPVVLPELMNPGVIEIEGNEVYILDGVVVYVYSLEDFKLLRKFGKKGEGPGELIPNAEITVQMKIFEGSVYVNSQSKMICFSKTGQLIKEKTFPFVAFQIIPLGQNYAVSAIGFIPGGAFLKAVILDEQLKELKTLCTAKGISGPAKGKLYIPPERLYIYRAGDKLFVVDTQNSSQIQVFDLEGNPLQPIKLNQVPIGATGAIQKEILDWMKNDIRFRDVPENLRKMFTVPDLLPVIRDLVVDNNKIYIQTYGKKGNSARFVVLNFNGKVLQELWLPQSTEDVAKLNPDRTYTFHNNKYYYLIEDMEKEEWKLDVEKIK